MLENPVPCHRVSARGVRLRVCAAPARESARNDMRRDNE